MPSIAADTRALRKRRARVLWVALLAERLFCAAPSFVLSPSGLSSGMWDRALVSLSLHHRPPFPAGRGAVPPVSLEILFVGVFCAAPPGQESREECARRVQSFGKRSFCACRRPDPERRNSGSTVLNPTRGAGGCNNAKRPPPWPRTGL
eukprot:3219076-Prymnesium_polylepis.1